VSYRTVLVRLGDYFPTDTQLIWRTFQSAYTRRYERRLALTDEPNPACAEGFAEADVALEPEGARNARFQARGLLALVREALGRGLIKESDAAAILQVDKKTLATLQADWFADPVTSIGQGKE
jgi:hypothetical protein